MDILHADQLLLTESGIGMPSELLLLVLVDNGDLGRLAQLLLGDSWLLLLLLLGLHGTLLVEHLLQMLLSVLLLLLLLLGLKNLLLLLVEVLLELLVGHQSGTRGKLVLLDTLANRHELWAASLLLLNNELLGRLVLHLKLLLVLLELLLLLLKCHDGLELLRGKLVSSNAGR